MAKEKISDDIIDTLEVPKQPSKPMVDIDQLAEIFYQTAGSIKGASGLLLWSWVTYSFMSWDILNQAAATYLTALWLLGVACFKLLKWANQEIVDNWTGGSYNLDPAEDLVMITGGSDGLGLLLLAMFSSDGFKTINVDIKAPGIAVALSTFVRCDVGNASEVKTMFSEFETPPTVIINCAGTVSGVKGALVDLDTDSISRVMATNSLGPIWLSREALSRASSTLKMFATISSSTALASPAFAGIYASSKAAVRSFCDSLRHEVAMLRGGTRVLCVIPGQLDTAMFQDIATPSPFWAPVASSVEVATQIYNAVHRGRQGEIAMPTYAWLLSYVLILPQSVIDLLRWVNGIDRAAAPQVLKAKQQ